MLLRWLILIWLPALAHAQNLDSLRTVCSQAIKNPTSADVPCLDNLGKAFYYKGAYDSAKKYYRLVVHLNKQYGTEVAVAAGYNDLGVAFYKLGEFDSCIFYYKKALDIYRRLNDIEHQAALELNLSIIYKDKGWYENALTLALQASSRYEKLPPQTPWASSYNTIALIYGKLNNFDYALSFHQKALSVRRQLGNRKGEAQSLNNIGNLYSEIHQYDSAYQYFLQSLAIKKELKDHASTASTLNNIGDILLAQEKFSSAESYYRQSLAIKEIQNDKPGEVITLNNLARLELLCKKYPQANLMLDRAEALGIELGLLEDLAITYDLRIRLLQAAHDFRSASIYAGKLMQVKDSLLTREKVQSLAEIQTRYETEKKEQRIVALEQEKELHQSELRANKLWITVLIGGATMLAVIGVLVYYLFRTEKKNKRAVEMLLKELHHRVKNNLQILSSVLGLQSQQLTDIHAIQAVKSSESRVNAMALIHRKLYAGEHNRTVNIKEYTTELVTYLVHTYGYYGKDLKLDLALEEIHLDVDKAIPLGLILNELISNAFKYAYEKQPTPELQIKFSTKNSRLFVQVSDNGEGIPDQVAKSKNSFGLKMVKMLVSELRGNLTTQSSKGTSYELNIPLS